jgi:hypothetical protein
MLWAAELNFTGTASPPTYSVRPAKPNPRPHVGQVLLFVVPYVMSVLLALEDGNPAVIDKDHQELVAILPRIEYPYLAARFVDLRFGLGDVVEAGGSDFEFEVEDSLFSIVGHSYGKNPP